MPLEGELAPDFVLSDQDGHTFQLSRLRGSPVVLYFYPKDDTPGCTIEAQEFSRDIEEFRKKGIVVFGVSKDTPESHCKFIKKYGLQLPLLSDVDAKVIKQYGLWKEKTLYGKKVMGTQRATFVIAADGHIMKVFPNVTPQGHSQEILRVFGAESI
jgi:peroxiredoxin Q/BCP